VSSKGSRGKSAPSRGSACPAAPGGFQALALCDFPSGAGAAAVLRMGEQLRVLSEDGEWWLVASQVSGKECLIPSSCVAKVRHRWLYEGVSREKAEELLLQPGNHSGAFLIRESQTRRGGFSLSVRRTELASWDAVTHYRIHRLENGWLYISPRLTFPSLHDLVDHYSECGEGLCCTLRAPCTMEVAKAVPAPARPAVVKKATLNWDKIDRCGQLWGLWAPWGQAPSALSRFLRCSHSRGLPGGPAQLYPPLPPICC
uniref:Src like adaptor 2 n=1 Tax=Pavo cristatus TaxID=9049 RepID=A0A8C9EKN5_PAVCR